jgi:starch synthase
VNGVGGLADTVIDYIPAASKGGRSGRMPVKPREGGRVAPKPGEGGTGFVLAGYTPAALLDALRRAIGAFGDVRQWKAIQLAGMRQDFSWDRSAREYVKIYERALAGAGG